MARKDRSTDLPAGGLHSPFGGLASLRDRLPEGRAPMPSKGGASKESAAPVRAVVRLERKGRGGREVTVISHLELKPAARETWCKALKSELGCGGSVEEDLIVLQGDQRARAKAALIGRGVVKVTVG